jgi:hypothetical protein
MDGMGGTSHATLALLFVACALAGCQAGRVEIRLDPIEELAAPSPANGHSTVVRVTDRRRDDLDPTVGHVVDGDDQPAAPIVADRDPHVWLEECLTARLRHAGFAVRAGDLPEFTVDVELFDCETAAVRECSARLCIALSITRDGVAVFPRVLLEASATGGTNFDRLADCCAAALDDATSQLLDQVVAACRDVAHVTPEPMRTVAKMSR